MKLGDQRHLNSPAHAHIRERMDKLIADVKKEIDQLRKDVA